MTVTPAEAARDLRKHAAAVKAALWLHTPSLPAFDLDEIHLASNEADDPNDPTQRIALPPIYAEVHVSQRYTGAGVRGGGPGHGEFRLLLKFVGTTVGEVQWADWVATRALEEKSLTVATDSGNQQTSPFVFEGVADLPEQEDDGELYIAAKELLYTL